MSAARTAPVIPDSYHIVPGYGGGSRVVSQYGEVALTPTRRGADEIVRALRLAAALPSVLAALDRTRVLLAASRAHEAHASNCATYVDDALAALDAAGAA